MVLVTDKKNSDTEMLFCRIFAFFLNALIITDSFRIINRLWFKLPLIYTEYFRNTMYIIIFIVFLCVFFRRFRSNLHELVIMAYIYLFAVLASVLATPEISPGLTEVTLTFFSRCVPAFFFARYIQDYGCLFKILRKFTLFYMVYSLSPYFFYMQQDYNKYMSYNLLIPSIVAVSCIFIEKRLIYIIPFILYMTTIILFGLRGPFIFVIAVILIYLVIQIKKVPVKYKFIILYFITVFFIVLPAVYDGSVSMLHSINPDSRTITLANENSFFDLTGRDEFYSSAVQLIKDSPLAFRGIISDRYLIGKVDLGIDTWISCYAHNLVLELAVQFGLIIAGLMVISLIVLLFRTFKYVNKSTDKYLTLFVSASIAFAFITPMFQGSYLTDYTFFLGLGVLMKKHTDNSTFRDVSRSCVNNTGKTGLKE